MKIKGGKMGSQERDSISDELVSLVRVDWQALMDLVILFKNIVSSTQSGGRA